ncbi:MAG: DHHA1 domain-containing protein, partial [Ignavibacteriaceae bacterium]
DAKQVKMSSPFNLDLETAIPIYAAIMTDTGSFRFERTTPAIHYIAAELLELGVNPSIVFDSIYDQSHFAKIKLLGKTLESLQLFGEKKEIGYMVIPREAFQSTGALESDTDGFVNFSLSVVNVKIGILFIELVNGFKVSFRSKGLIPVNKLAVEFGGGGHSNAAGARFFNKKLSDYVDPILNKAEKYLKNNKG